MDAEKKLIIGLGNTFKSTNPTQNTILLPVVKPYAAVRICSSQDQNLPTDSLFLGQPYCVDMRRHLLKQLLPFLDKQPSKIKKAPFSDFNISRRYARMLFSQHQDWVWSSVAASLRDNITKPNSIVILVDMSDSFASAVWIDCLYGLKQRYPEANFYPVFLLPKMIDLSITEAAVIGAAITELSQLSQGKWTPNDISTGDMYPNDTPLWSVAYLQQRPDEHSDEIILQLVDSLVTLSNVEHNDYGTLRQSLTQEYQKILRPITTKSAQLLPRFASMLEISLDFNVEILENLLAEQCQSKLLAALSHIAFEQETYDLPYLETIGCILNDEQLYLNVDSCDAKIETSLSIEEEWEQYKQQLLNQIGQQSDNWHEQSELIAGNFRIYYDKKFRQKGVEKYYEHSDARLNKMSKAYVSKIENLFWQAWKQGKSGLSALQNAVESLIIHYVQNHHNYLVAQEQAIDQVKASASWWENISGQWQRADAQTRLQIETEYPISEVANKMGDLFIQRCHYKANVFAERLILGMQPYLLNLQQQLSNASEAWLFNATQIQKALNQHLDNQQEDWLDRVSATIQSRYLLQPNKASLQVFSECLRSAIDEAALQMHQFCLDELDDKANFMTLLNFIQQASWKKNVVAISQQTAHQILSSEPETLRKALGQRITELEQAQVQYLGRFTLSNLTSQFRKLIHPLGEMLTTQYNLNESACLLCEDNIQKHELVSTWLAQCVQQSLPKAKVMSLHGERSVQFAYASTCYLDEWVELADFLNAYRQFKFNDEALLHLHIDGSNETIAIMQKNSINRNRELIRQHLLLALITGRLVTEEDHYVLYISDANTALSFETNDLADVVDYIGFDQIKQLVDSNEQARKNKVFSSDAARLIQNLDQVLERIKAANLPEGIDLEDADWSDAGRYVVWSRAAHYLRTQWLKEPKTGKKQRVA